MKKYISFSLFSILALTSSLSALDTTDRDAIHNIVEHVTHSWNAHQGRGFADHYTPDADFVNIFGMAFLGKKEIEERHIEILKTFLKGSIFEVTGLKLREAKPDVVIAQVHWKVTNIKNPMKGVFTHTFVKNQDGWEITSSQNTLISKE
ncbi:MAG: SgcJ/EcaC family oxidoreductase [Chlamydiota bacterium]